MKCHFPFMRYRKFFVLLAAFLMVASVACILFLGFNTGIDFTGGNLIQIEFPQEVNVAEVRGALSKIGYGQATIQAFSKKGIMVRLQSHNIKPKDLQNQILGSLTGLNKGKAVITSFEMVGPTVGGELRRQALWASLISLAGILLYVTFRFQFRFALVSVAALVHDTVLVLGLFSLIRQEVDMTFIAAILTTIGYSLNNSIVILDRVREEWNGLATRGIEAVLDDSINSTLSRTINTTVTTFLPVLAFYIWGGPVLAGFSIAIMAGLIFGGYSSICVVGSLLMMWYEKSKQH